MTAREIYELSLSGSKVDRDVALSVWQLKSTADQKYEAFQKAGRLMKFLLPRSRYCLKTWDAISYVKHRLA